MKNTIQRRIIMEELGKLDSHPSADRLYELVRRRLPQISLGTVYRNLEKMAAAGLILKLELPECQKRFDGNTGNHLHLRCTVCGAVEDVMGVNPDKIAKSLQKIFDNPAIQDYRLELYGKCRKCNTANQGENE